VRYGNDVHDQIEDSVRRRFGDRMSLQTQGISAMSNGQVFYRPHGRISNDTFSLISARVYGLPTNLVRNAVGTRVLESLQ